VLSHSKCTLLVMTSIRPLTCSIQTGNYVLYSMVNYQKSDTTTHIYNFKMRAYSFDTDSSVHRAITLTTSDSDFVSVRT
jgi:hypothetical protein